MPTPASPCCLPRLQQIGGLVCRKVLHGPAIDGQYSIAGAYAGLFGGAGRNYPHDYQPAVLGFKFHAQAHEVALDLSIHFAKLIGGQIGGIWVQGVRRPAEKLQNHGRRSDIEPPVCQLGGL